MARLQGRPAYPRKTRATSFVCQMEAWLKLEAAMKRTGRSNSDIINHLALKYADGITRETFERVIRKQDRDERRETTTESAGR